MGCRCSGRRLSYRAKAWFSSDCQAPIATPPAQPVFLQDMAIAFAAEFERVVHSCSPMMTFCGTYPEVFPATVAAGVCAGVAVTFVAAFVVCAEPSGTVARAPGVDDGRAPTFITPTVTKRASSQSAHLPALTSRSPEFDKNTAK